MVGLHSNTLTKTVAITFLIKLKLNGVVYAHNPSQEAEVGRSQVQSQLSNTGRRVLQQIKCKIKSTHLSVNLTPKTIFP